MCVEREREREKERERERDRERDHMPERDKERKRERQIAKCKENYDRNNTPPLHAYLAKSIPPGTIMLRQGFLDRNYLNSRKLQKKQNRNYLNLRKLKKKFFK